MRESVNPKIRRALCVAGFFIFLLASGDAALQCGGGEVLSWHELAEAPMIFSLRLRRLLLGLTVGGALAVAGTAYQAVLRNVLAEPYILGVSGGASLGAAATICAGWTVFSVLALPMGAFLGAAAALLVVLAAGRSANGDFRNGVLLSGVVVGSVCGSILMFLISVMGGTRELNSITWWLLGSLQIYDTMLLPFAIILVLAGTAALFLLGNRIDVLTLGEESAHHFGVPVRATVLTVLGIASLLAAVTVAMVGIIGFAGLIVPHLLRRFFGNAHRTLFPAALIGGGIFLIWCDLAAQSIFPAREIPVGVMTAFLGGPFFLWAIRRRFR